jgi:hypothetical protein
VSQLHWFPAECSNCNRWVTTLGPFGLELRDHYPKFQGFRFCTRCMMTMQPDEQEPNPEGPQPPGERCATDGDQSAGSR